MQSFIFKTKLAKLNHLLFVDDSAKSRVSDEWSVVGLFLRNNERAKSRTFDYASLDGKTREYMKAYDEGNLYEHIGSVPHGYVPENDLFDINTGRLLARGWRSIVLRLVEKRLCTIDKARSVFSRSLGESDYDRLNSDQKRRLAGWEPYSAREELRRKGYT